MTINKRKSVQVKVSNVLIGGDAPVVIQSMTNTDTADVNATVKQIIELIKAGSEIVRITVNNENSAIAVPKIKQKLLKLGYKTPIVGDFHYNGHALLTRYPEMAKALDKYRINPGNVGVGKAHGYNFATMIKVAIKYKKPVRIGVNWGSLDQSLLTKLMDKNKANSLKKAASKSKTNVLSDREVLYEAMVQSALNSQNEAIKLGLPLNKIILSVKMSDVQDVILVNQMLAKRTDAAIHLGLTEAGMSDKGIVASVSALAVLLQQGIGDTIRVSLTPEPSHARAREVEICQLVLQTMGLRQASPPALGAGAHQTISINASPKKLTATSQKKCLNGVVVTPASSP